MTKFNKNDLIGKKYAKLTILEINKYTATCKCDCGNITTKNLYNILAGNTKSCGCIKVQRARNLGKSRRKQPIYCWYCGKPAYARGFCRNCYSRFMRNGSVDYIQPRKEKPTRVEKLQERFKPKSDKGKQYLQELIDGKTIEQLAAENNCTKQAIYKRLHK